MTNHDTTNIDGQLAALLLDGTLAKELGLGDQELGTALAVANLNLSSGNGEKAFSIYAMLVLLQPINVDFQCGLANCALQMDEYEVALQAASAVVGIAPRDCRGYYFSAAACLGLGHIAEAKEDIADALQFASDSPQPGILAACQKLSQQLSTVLA